MGSTPRAIRRDLQRRITGNVLTDEVSRCLYSTDASIYQVRPLAVVLPRDADDVMAAVQYARHHEIPLAPRGGGSGLAGESLCAGLVLDFSRYMNRVLAFDPASGRVRVQPGLVLERLNAQLAPYGRQFGPDPSSGNRATVGGMLGTNATGVHSLKYGYTGDHVHSTSVILAGGDPVAFSPEGVSGYARGRQIVEELTVLLGGQEDLIREHQPRSPRHRAGYALHRAAANGQLDVPSLLVGSEGTLAVFTEATLATVPVPPARGVVMLVFSTMEAAAAAITEVLTLSPAACEIMDRHVLDLARQADPQYASMLPTEAEAVIVVEHDGADGAEVRKKIAATVDRLCRETGLAEDTAEALDPSDQATIWRIRKVAVPLLYRRAGPAQPTPFIEDAAVPPEHLAEYARRLTEILERHRLPAALYGHAGHGELHVRPYLDLRTARDIDRMRQVADEVYEAVWALGGSISGEHGLGLARTAFLRRQSGPLYPLMQQVKELFDPKGVLNPGKVIADDPDQMVRHLRFGTGYYIREPETVLRWRPGELAEVIERCNGCGHCRSLDHVLAMCPVFRATGEEAASPRAKPNLLRDLLGGKLRNTALTDEAVRQVTDLCVNCKMCLQECPSGVDIAKLVLEARSQYVRQHGLTRVERALSRAGSLSGLAGAAAGLANRALESPFMRRVAEILVGVDRRRKLPRFHRKSFMKRARKRGLTQPAKAGPDRVAYFLDLFANHNDPALAEAAVAVLEHNGVAVHVPRGQTGCGMPFSVYGDARAARRAAERNVGVLARAVRDGYTIVSSEPTATLMIQHEYRDLLGNDDVQLVAEHTHDLCHYLWSLHEQGRLKQGFEPLPRTVGYHAPCHLSAMGIGTPGRRLLELVPQLRIVPIQEGCCGMAGTYGMKADTFDTSMAAGSRLLKALRQPEIEFGVTECSTCKMQMEQGADKPTLHPIKLLAFAYGLMPEVEGLMDARPGKLTIT